MIHLKNYSINLLLVFVGISASLVILEIVFRLASLAPELTLIEVDMPYGTFVSSENTLLKYEPKPHSPDINSVGMRDREFSLNKPPSTQRIAVLGDSIGFGFCNDQTALPPELTFSKQLEKSFNQNGTFGKVEVLNFSVSGYDTLQESEILRSKANPYSPDLIVIAFCLNDLWEASAELSTIRANATESSKMLLTSSGKTLYTTLFIKSAFFRWLILKSKASFQNDNPANSGWAKISLGFNRIKELAQERPVIVTLFPLFADFHNYPYGNEHAIVEKSATEFGFQYLDLLPYYSHASDFSPEKLQLPCNREHPNAEGHRVAAEAIFERIKRDQLLPMSTNITVH